MKGLFTLRSLCVVFILVMQVACNAPEKSAQHYYQQGKALLEQGNIELAQIQFRNALQIEPKLSDAYYQIALIDEKKQDIKGMYNNLAEAVRLEPKHVDAHLKLGQLYLVSRQFDKALDEAAVVVQLQPDYPGGLTLHAAVLFSQGKKAESLAEVSRALEMDPTYYDAVTLKASIYLAESKYPEALAMLKANIELKPLDVGLQLMKIRAEAEIGNKDAVVADYRTLVLQNPNSKELTTGMVALLLTIDRQEQAVAILRQIIDKEPGNVEAKLKLVSLLELRDAAEAERMLKQFVEAQPKSLAMLNKAADFYEARKRYADAEVMLKRILELDNNSREGLSAKIKLARVALAQNDGRKAESLVAGVLTADAANPQALLLRAGMRLDRNESDAAIADLQTALGAQPNYAVAQEMLARAYTQKGELALAASTRRKALEGNATNIEAALPVVMLMLKTGGDLAQAEQILQTALKANPGNPRGLEMLAQVRTARKDWEGAQAAVAELARQPGAGANVLFLSAEILSRQGNYAESIHKYQQALAEKPDFAPAIQGIGQAYLAQGKPAGLVAYIKSFIIGNPRVIAAYEVLGMAYGAEKKWADAVKVLRDGLGLDPKSVSTYEALANVYLAQGKPADAVEVYRKGLVEQPDSISLRMDLAQHYATHQDVDSAIALLSDTVEKYPDNDLAINSLSWLVAMHRTDRESLDRASKLVERFSTSSDPHLLDTYAWVSLLAGNKDKAVPAMKKVVEAAPDSAVFQYHLGTAYYQTSNWTEARKALEKSIALAKKQGVFRGQENAEKLVKELSIVSDGKKAQ